MFQFSGFASLAGFHVFNVKGCPIRKSADRFVCADPRGLSQLIASFLASESQGIPRTPFVIFFKVVEVRRSRAVLDVSMFSFSHYVNERASNFSHFPFSLRRYAKGAGRMIRPRGFESLGSFSKSLTKRLSVRCRSLGMVWWR